MITTYCQTSPIVTPTRIQRKRVKGWRKPEGAVDCTRHKGGKWGNDYRIEKKGRLYTIINDKTGYMAFHGTPRGAAEHAVEMFQREQLPTMDCSELAGKTLMCWCALDMPCHVDAILRKANRW